MANQTQLIDQTPLQAAVIGQEGRFSYIWQRWFASLQTALSQFFKPFTIPENALAGGNLRMTYPVLVITQLTTEQRDGLTEIENGAVIYNTTTQKFNFRQNDTWKELP
jgi:hypothetical protein